MLSVILVAAGSSRRMGFDKLFAEIAGKPVIAHSLVAFERAESVHEIIVVAQEERHSEIERTVRDENLKKVGGLVCGGEDAYRIVTEKKLMVTDEVSAVELIGRKVALVVNEEFNFKITYPRDFALAEFILQQRVAKP